MKLDEKVKVIENLESGHSCQKCEFLSNEDICNMLENLPESENSPQDDTRWALIYIAGYICCNDERIDGTFFYYEIYGSVFKGTSTDI